MIIGEHALASVLHSLDKQIQENEILTEALENARKLNARLDTELNERIQETDDLKHELEKLRIELTKHDGFMVIGD